MSKPLQESILHIRFEKEFPNQEKISADCKLKSAYHGSYTCTFTPKTSLQNISEFVVDLFNTSTISAERLYLQLNDQEIEVRKPYKTTDNASEHYLNLIVTNLLI